MVFGSAAWFLLLLALPLVAWWMFVRRTARGVRWSDVRVAKALEPTWRQRSRWVPSSLRLIALALLIVALAQPRQGITQRRIEAEGIAMALVVDRSDSMHTLDFEQQGRAISRLAAVCDVAARFVAGDDTQAGRVSDLVGLTAFAGVAETLCPLTLDHGYLLARLERLAASEPAREDGSALGDAVGLAVAHLHELDQRRVESRRARIPSQIVIVLTDGEQNAGTLPPLQAAELAAAVDVRVYAVGVGGGPTATRSGTQTLQRMATLTGGRFYRAADREALENISAEIAALETSRLETHSQTDYRELAIEPFQLGPFGFPPLALAALVLFALAMLGDATLYRRVA